MMGRGHVGVPWLSLGDQDDMVKICIGRSRQFLLTTNVLLWSFIMFYLYLYSCENHRDHPKLYLFYIYIIYCSTLGIPGESNTCCNTSSLFACHKP